MSAQKLRMLAQRAQNVGLRLGFDTEIIATFSRRPNHDFQEYALKFPECSLEQIENLLAWLDYYVPTDDKQAGEQYGPLYCDRPKRGAA